MKAAVVNNFEQVPQYQSFEKPQPQTKEQLIQVRAASVNHRVQSQADGTHYTSDGKLPFIPGLDGVGQLADGRLAYFVTSNPIYGSLAEQTVVDHRRIIPLPSDIDVNSVAASMNPAMSSWMALKSRLGTDINSKKIMILGATGNSGSLAVEISHYLGAKSVVAIGRNRDKLAKLTAEKTISLLDEPAKLKQEIKEVADVDVVLDYLWGDAAKQVMLALLPARSNHSQSLTWIEIGSMAGADLVLPSAALRSINLNLIGSGQGSIDPKLFLTELPALAQLISQGKFNVDVEAVPLDQVTSKWNLKTDRRLVFNP
ncbi:hypothetical protein LOOC260_112560 [Paucilactobacillus hokkaidonensis JCM 18461]|uniref:NADPH:quinone reductase n=2 Tax=Paucilactobacillus hokkaidonensis TaxID=1193095 RepID=A0A0A1GY23_9LACO|nr:zinc-binding alcohol dehydrogenase family protein [Paucilactobacillus hokkaidonensis]KRO10340.1 alcohol dehydrogenase zinc-binding domain-containing protein [Paucilactobacillus hokkaidonensis]BAP85794.1 hypothetical protein LOOC260_112560 [Paucilactobacillus hokkaidonensis JCM 18461]